MEGGPLNAEGKKSLSPKNYLGRLEGKGEKRPLTEKRPLKKGSGKNVYTKKSRKEIRQENSTIT